MLEEKFGEKRYRDADFYTIHMDGPHGYIRTSAPTKRASWRNLFLSGRKVREMVVNVLRVGKEDTGSALDPAGGAATVVAVAETLRPLA